jgi:hypothetical protein
MPETLSPMIAVPLAVAVAILVTVVDVYSPPTTTASPSAARAGTGRPIAAATNARTPPAEAASSWRRERTVSMDVAIGWTSAC